MQGWHPDPSDRHEARYFSQGVATKLVRDGAQESYDEPPAATPDGRAGVPSGLVPGVPSVPEQSAAREPEAAPQSVAGEPAPQPGWYPDPLDPDRARYWTGEHWSESSERVSRLRALLEHEPDRFAEVSR